MAHASSSALQYLYFRSISTTARINIIRRWVVAIRKGSRNVEDKEASITWYRAISPQAQRNPLSEDEGSLLVPNKTLGGSTSQLATTSTTLAPGSCTYRHSSNGASIIITAFGTKTIADSEEPMEKTSTARCNTIPISLPKAPLFYGNLLPHARSMAFSLMRVRLINMQRNLENHTSNVVFSYLCPSLATSIRASLGRLPARI